MHSVSIIKNNVLCCFSEASFVNSIDKCCPSNQCFDIGGQQLDGC